MKNHNQTPKTAKCFAHNILLFIILPYTVNGKEKTVSNQSEPVLTLDFQDITRPLRLDDAMPFYSRNIALKSHHMMTLHLLYSHLSWLPEIVNLILF